jgi:hypothetical protein
MFGRRDGFAVFAGRRFWPSWKPAGQKADGLRGIGIYHP